MLQGKGQFDQAISDCTKAIEYETREYAEAYIHSGDLPMLQGKGQFDQAISDFSKGHRDKPEALLWPTYNRGVGLH